VVEEAVRGRGIADGRWGMAAEDVR
jgi:hypothetical protein